MALTFEPVVGKTAGESANHLQFLILDVTGDGAMAAGGESFSAANVGLTTIYAVLLGGVDAEALGYVPFYNTATSKLAFYRDGESGSASTLAEFTGDASTFTIRVVVIGV